MTSSDKDRISDPGFLNGGNMSYLESIYQESRVDEQVNGELARWKSVFDSLPESGARVEPVASDGRKNPRRIDWKVSSLCRLFHGQRLSQTSNQAYILACL